MAKAKKAAAKKAAPRVPKAAGVKRRREEGDLGEKSERIARNLTIDQRLLDQIRILKLEIELGQRVTVSIADLLNAPLAAVFSRDDITKAMAQCRSYEDLVRTVRSFIVPRKR